MNPREHGKHEPVLDLVQMQPLAEDAGVGQALPQATVELLGEQARHAADPRIGGLRDDDVEPLARRREERPRIIVPDGGAFIIEHPTVRGIERARSFDHRGFDLDGGDPHNVRRAQQGMGRHPGPLPHDRRALRLRSVSEGQQGKQHLRRGIRLQGFSTTPWSEQASSQLLGNDPSGLPFVAIVRRSDVRLR